VDVDFLSAAVALVFEQAGCYVVVQGGLKALPAVGYLPEDELPLAGY